MRHDLKFSHRVREFRFTEPEIWAQIKEIIVALADDITAAFTTFVQDVNDALAARDQHVAALQTELDALKGAGTDTTAFQAILDNIKAADAKLKGAAEAATPAAVPAAPDAAPAAPDAPPAA